MNFINIIRNKALNDLFKEEYHVIYENEFDSALRVSDAMNIDELIEYASDNDHCIFLCKSVNLDELKKLSSELHKIAGDNNG